MATSPVLVFHDGKLDVPEDLQRDWKLREGSELRVVSSSKEFIVLESAEDAAAKIAKPIGDWRRLEGILAGTDEHFSATEWKRQEREWELAHDERKFGTKRPSW